MFIYILIYFLYDNVEKSWIYSNWGYSFLFTCSQLFVKPKEFLVKNLFFFFFLIPRFGSFTDRYSWSQRCSCSFSSLRSLRRGWWKVLSNGITGCEKCSERSASSHLLPAFQSCHWSVVEQSSSWVFIFWQMIIDRDGFLIVYFDLFYSTCMFFFAWVLFFFKSKVAHVKEAF